MSETPPTLCYCTPYTPIYTIRAPRPTLRAAAHATSLQCVCVYTSEPRQPRARSATPCPATSHAARPHVRSRTTPLAPSLPAPRACLPANRTRENRARPSSPGERGAFRKTQQARAAREGREGEGRKREGGKTRSVTRTATQPRATTAHDAPATAAAPQHHRTTAPQHHSARSPLTAHRAPGPSILSARSSAGHRR